MPPDRTSLGPDAKAHQFARILESVGSGLAVLRGRQLVIEAVSPAFAALAPGAEVVGHPVATVCPELAARVTPTALRVLDSGEPFDVRELPLPSTDARNERRNPRYVTLRLRRMAGPDGEPRLWVALMDATSQVRARERAELLTSFSVALNSHDEVPTVVRRTLRRSVALLGAHAGALWLLEADGSTLRAAMGSPIPEVEDEKFDLRTLPILQRVMEARSAVFVTRGELIGAEADLFQRLDLSAGLIAPLVVGARKVGVLTMSFREIERQPDEEDLAFAAALAAQSALAIERIRAVDRARRAQIAVAASQARLRLLADVGKILSAALDWDSAVRATTRLAVGRLADWGILDMVDAAGSLQRESIRCHASIRIPGWSPTPGERDGALAEVIRTNLPRWWDLSRGVDIAGTPSRHLASLREAGAAFAVLAPLLVHREVLGVLTLARTGRPYDMDDVNLAQDLANLVALALRNARLARSAELATEAREDIVGMASHELRTPLTVLGLQVRLLTSSAPDESTKRRANVIQRATDRLARAVEQLLDVAHIADGAPRMGREPLDLVALVRDTVARESPDLERDGCSVNLSAPDRLTVIGDPSRIGGAVQHLLDQAAQFGPGKPVDVVVTTRHGRPIVEVRYRGPPIAPEVRERLVAPFDRRAARLNQAEIGLGFWIARWIMEAHGGRIAVHSRDDGASFVAEFPIAGATAAT